MSDIPQLRMLAPDAESSTPATNLEPVQDDETPAWAKTLIQQQDSMRQELEQIKELVASIQSEVGPIIDDLMNIPMLKMLIGKGK